MIRKLRERWQCGYDSGEEEDYESEDEGLSDVDEDLVMYTDDEKEEEHYAVKLTKELFPQNP